MQMEILLLAILDTAANLARPVYTSNAMRCLGYRNRYLSGRWDLDNSLSHALATLLFCSIYKSNPAFVGIGVWDAGY
ncbi:hypothetical protein V8C42DRAFT_311961 [Trichoderma barbatum]